MIINPFDNEQEFTSSDKLITHLTQLAVDKNNVFRGYGKQSELFPNIIREKDWREQEIRLLHEFERYGLQYFSANNPIDFMSYARESQGQQAGAAPDGAQAPPEQKQCCRRHQQRDQCRNTDVW